MRMLLSIFPDEIIDKYKLKALTINGWVYLDIRKGMYGLKQASLPANKLLKSDRHPLVIIQLTTHWACGYIKPDP
jgi:hypothetical protein